MRVNRERRPIILVLSVLWYIINTVVAKGLISRGWLTDRVGKPTKISIPTQVGPGDQGDSCFSFLCILISIPFGDYNQT